MMMNFIFQKYIDDDDEDEMGAEVDVYPKQFGERFMLRLLDFHLKLQVNLAEEGHGNKHCNVSVLATHLFQKKKIELL